MFNPRPNQKEILSYTHGFMGVSAVPGSGKTHTLSRLAANLISANVLDDKQEILIVTLVNSAVPDSRARANTLFGMHVWSGNAVGAFLTSWTFAHFGWLAVCGVAMTAMVIALLIHLGVFPVGKTE